MRIRELAFVIAMAVAMSCSKREPDLSGKLIQTPLPTIAQLRESHSLLSLFENDTTVQLETNDSSLLSGIDWVAKHDTLIAVLDARTKRVLLFSMRGKFLGDIGSQGANYQQYANPRDVLFIGGQIGIVDGSLNKMILFDIQRKFLKEIVFSQRTCGLAFTPYLCDYSHSGRCFFIYVEDPGNTAHRIVKLSESFKTVASFGDFDGADWTGQHMDARRNTFVDSNGNYWMTSTYTSRVFVYDPKGILLKEINFAREDKRFLNVRVGKNALVGDIQNEVTTSFLLDQVLNISNRFVVVHCNLMDKDWRTYTMDGNPINKEMGLLDKEDLSRMKMSWLSEEDFWIVGQYENGIILEQENPMRPNGVVGNPSIVFLKVKSGL